jgi:hypothetical protein
MANRRVKFSDKSPDSYFLYTSPLSGAISLHRAGCWRRRLKLHGTVAMPDRWTGPLTAAQAMIIPHLKWCKDCGTAKDGK